MIAWLRKNHWLHDWTAWEQTTAIFTSIFDRGGYRKIIQLRTCNTCKLVQRKDL